jgi:hypothetical protein
MRKVNFLLVIVVCFICCTSCSKEDDPLFETLPVEETDSLISTSQFMSQGSYQVSGQMRVFLIDSMYVFEFSDFKSSSGPALEVWLSDGLQPKVFLSLGKLKSTSGNFFYTVGITKDQLKQYNHVLIWCERFSVGFGNAPINQ